MGGRFSFYSISTAWLNSLAWAAILYVLPTEQKPWDWAEAMEALLPDQEETEEEEPLTEPEREQLLAWATEGMEAAESVVRSR
jgi:hypothetical protein